MGRSRWARGRGAVLGLWVCAGLLCPAPAGTARAFDFFGLFGGEKAPEPSAAALPYDLTFETTGGDDLSDTLRQVSGLERLRQDAPPDGEALVGRARADFPPLIDALWAQGYYNARVTIEIAGVPVMIAEPDAAARAVRAANAYRGRARVPVKVTAEPGPLFRFREIQVLDARTRQPIPPEELPPRVVKLAPGDPAVAPDIRAAVARVVDHYRRQSYPLAKVPLPAPVVDHAALTVDVVVLVDPGPKAGIGPVTVTGPQTFPQEVVRSFIYLEEGEPYSPKAIDDTRRSIATIPAVGSVRIREAGGLDRNGNLPVFVEVTDRAPNLVGLTAGFSTVDGPNGRVFYENRNVFGEAERFRIEGAAFLAPRNNGTRLNDIGDLRFSDIGARLTTSFLKPALGGSRFDFLLDGIVERNRTGGGRFGGYTDRLGGATAALRYRFDENWFAQGGIKYERGRTSDVISNVDYQLVGFPLTVAFDTTDKLLDPSEGVRVRGTLTPYPGGAGSSVEFTRGTLDVSGYLAVDEDARVILAARGGFGTILDDPGLASIPSNYRFYAGGGGSIRGYRYQTVAPRGPFGFVVGGKSLLEGNFEARVKVTDTIGIVPFFDIGGAYTDRMPGIRGDTRMAAGLGLRYFTAIGPIRLDVATPINPRRGDKPVVLYVSIGQSF